MTSPLHWRVERDGAPALEVPTKRNGGILRIAWGEVGQRAGLWVISMSKHGDVYAMERTFGGALKLSMHKSGDFRWAFTMEGLERSAVARAAVAARAGNRIIQRWTRPEATNGLVPVFRIVTTGADVVRVPDDRARQSTHWLAPPLTDEVAWLELALVHPTKVE